MRFIRPKMLMAASAFALVAAACGGATPEGEGGGGGAEGDAPQIGVALDIGGLGDKSFNDAADRGLQQAIEDGLVPEENAELLESNATGSNRDENVVNLADQGFDLIWANGFAFSEGIAEIAPDYPDVNFAIHVGFLGGQEGIGLIENFQAGWDAGVQATCPDCELLTEYIGDSTAAFVDPTRGEALSAAMYDDGADVIYHAAGQSGLGLFKAAVAADALAIGVDSDQYLTASPEEREHILTSMLKRVDVAIYDTIEAVTNDAFEPGSQIFGLAEDGVGYATSNPELLTEEIQAQLEDFKQQIIDGEITVPEQPGE